MSEITATILSLFAATAMAALGYLKSMSEEKFQKEKLVSTYLAALIVAVLSVGFNVQAEVGDELFFFFIMQSGAIVYIERILKFIWRTYILPHMPGD